MPDPITDRSPDRWEPIARCLRTESERHQPDAVLAELLHVLCGRLSNVFLVGLGGGLIGLYAYLRQAEHAALGFGLLGSALMLVRYRLLVGFRRHLPAMRRPEIDRWFIAFGLAGIASSVAWGALCFSTLIAARDPVLYALALTATVAAAASIAARNAAAPRVARLQISAMLLPAMIGAPLTGNQAYDFLFVLIPALLWGLSILTMDLNRQMVESFRSRIKLAAMSNVDYLTQVGNRRAFGTSSADAAARCAVLRQPLAILMIDVDYFKAYNDHYGHQAGDVCLQQVAALLSDNLRHQGDIVSRYGGEEFAVSLQNADATEAASVAQRLRTAIETAAIPHAARHDRLGVVTVSIGTVATAQLSVGLDALVHAADRALYEAKHGGRNRIAAAPAFEHVMS